MSIGLVDIIGVDPDWETAHRVKALEVDGRSFALAGLANIKKKDPAEHNRLMRAIKLVVGTKRLMGTPHVKADAQGRGVYEMRAQYARLFFFYTSDTDEIVVCTHLYEKTDSKNKQNREFEKCAELRDLYEAQRERDTDNEEER